MLGSYKATTDTGLVLSGGMMARIILGNGLRMTQMDTVWKGIQTDRIIAGNFRQGCGPVTGNLKCRLA
jgi:hypothetical protein